MKENVRAKLKVVVVVVVERMPQQFSYLPHMQVLATETVLNQAKMVAGELGCQGDGDSLKLYQNRDLHHDTPLDDTYSGKSR